MLSRCTIFPVVVCFLFVGIHGTIGDAFADASIRPWVSKVISVQGRVLAKRSGKTHWRRVVLNDTLFAGDRIRVEANSRAGIRLSNDAVLRLDQNTTLVFTEIEKEATFIFKLLRGAANFFSSRSRSLKFLTPFVNGVVEGTEFYVQVDVDQTRIELFEGRIRAQNPYGEIQLAKGQGALATADGAPQRQVLVKPRESVQWALYYPPAMALGAHDIPAPFKPSLALYNEDRIADAIDALDQIPEGDRDAQFFSYRAALLLHVGRVVQAMNAIGQALALDPDSGDALALQAVIAVVQNKKDKAMAAAQKAVKFKPSSATAQIALSYAHQASFNLPQALEAAHAAVTHTPDDGTAWSRLAELQLSTGELDKGSRSARKAAKLNPRVAHAHTIAGFAELIRINANKAQEAFNQAIILDSAAPLPRLGLGLAKIRNGDLKAGRVQIEIAAALDPSNALIRSYLGKAYFDEKRGPLDKTQFEIAKTLDPNDPTPYYYDAIRKQAFNRPVEALQDLHKSIELNDNRAVYRSRLLLDQDLAARNVALGSIYNDLSFQQLAIREGSKSLLSDPTNFSAHRLLSDIYASRPRHEIAQVSELLQSQLFQPLILTPVQPQLAESSLTAPEAAGPLKSSFNEFNPLFTRDRPTLQLSGAVGNNSTWSDEVSIAGLYKRYSYSVGQYHFETDGFRPNNNLEKDIYNIFGQTVLSPRSSIQLEYRQKDVTHGDLELRYDPDNFFEPKQVSRKEKIPRIGFHYAPDEQHHFIASFIYNQTEFSRTQKLIARQTPNGPIVVDEGQFDEDDAYNLEAQYLYRNHVMNLIIGAGYYKQDLLETESNKVTMGSVTLLPRETLTKDLEAWHANVYGYSHLQLIPNFGVSLGVSADSYSKEEVDERQLNPKFGFNWKLLPSLSIRGTVFRSFKRSLVSNQTIEPTQIVGFSQFYDDLTATDAKRYGLGLDYQITDDFLCGAELTFNDMSHPRGTPVRTEEHIEYHHLLYLYWTPAPQLSVSSEYRFDDYERDPLPRDAARPYKLRTHSVPITVAYFHHDGLFAKVRGTYINQRVEQIESSASPAEIKRDDFTLVDIGIGYRLPKRYGIVSFSVSNVFDTKFNYQDSNFLTANEQEPDIKPERQFILKLTCRL